METMKLMNAQIAHELESAYSYLSMSAFLEGQNLKGMSAWMKKQAAEEMSHAIKFYDFMISRGWKVDLQQVPKPKSDWGSAQDVFEEAYSHEKKISSLINGIMTKATEEKDYPTVSMLQWFVTEQVEEEQAALEIVEKLKMVAGHKGALLMLDRELGARQ